MVIWPKCGASATKYKERGMSIVETASELSTGRVKPKRTEESRRGLKTWLSTRVKNCRRVFVRIAKALVSPGFILFALLELNRAHILCPRVNCLTTRTLSKLSLVRKQFARRAS